MKELSEMEKTPEGALIVLSDEEKAELQASRKPKKQGLRKHEHIIAQLEEGYLFHNGDGVVRFRTDIDHDAEKAADQFVEPVKASQSGRFPS